MVKGNSRARELSSCAVVDSESEGAIRGGGAVQAAGRLLVEASIYGTAWEEKWRPGAVEDGEGAVPRPTLLRHEH